MSSTDAMSFANLLHPQQPSLQQHNQERVNGHTSIYYQTIHRAHTAPPILTAVPDRVSHPSSTVSSTHHAHYEPAGQPNLSNPQPLLPLVRWHAESPTSTPWSPARIHLQHDHQSSHLNTQQANQPPYPPATDPQPSGRRHRRRRRRTH